MLFVTSRTQDRRTVNSVLGGIVGKPVGGNTLHPA